MDGDERDDAELYTFAAAPTARETAPAPPLLAVSVREESTKGGEVPAWDDAVLLRFFDAALEGTEPAIARAPVRTREPSTRALPPPSSSRAEYCDDGELRRALERGVAAELARADRGAEEEEGGVEPPMPSSSTARDPGLRELLSTYFNAGYALGRFEGTRPRSPS